jgi:tetratricopeptide (TPR) repeat protein
LRDSNPKFARRIAAEAAGIAHRAEWPLLRADALLELGCALIRLSDLPKADEVLIAAEQSLDAAGQSDVYGKALVWYSRAVVAREQRRFDEALGLSQKASKVFQDVDTRMLSATMFMAANVLFAKREFAEAAMAMEELLASGRLDADCDMRAMALHNCGAMHARVGHEEAALLRLSEAAALFEQSGQETRVATSDWWLALLLTRFGAYHDAVEALDRARADLRRLGLSNESSLAALDLAEALLLIGEKRRAAAMCKDVVLVFTAAEMQHEANRAIAYIREATERGTATPNEVREVRLFLEDLPNRPAAPPS